MKRIIKEEKGFWSAVFVVLMVTLGVLATGSHYVMTRETENSTNSTLAIQVDYSANAAAYYGIKALRNGIMSDGVPLDVTVSGIDVELVANQTVDANSKNIWRLNVDSENSSGASRALEIDLEIPIGLENLAIAAEGEVANTITPYTQTNSIDWNLIQENTELPEIDMAALGLLSIWTFTDGKMGMKDGFDPNAIAHAWADSIDDDPFFYWKDGVKLPHVIHVTQDATFWANATYYGIFVVDGNVTIQNGQTNIYGVILQMDPTDTIYEEEVEFVGSTPNQYKFSGGVVSYGNVNAKGNPSVQHNPTYMREFAKYANEDLSNLPVISWKYK